MTKQLNLAVGAVTTFLMFCAIAFQTNAQDSQANKQPADGSATKQDQIQQDIPRGAATAGECAEKYFSSLLSGNQETMFDVTIFPTAEDRLLHASIVRFGGAADRFRTKFVETYGREAWDLFNDDTHVPFDPDAANGGNGSITIMERELVPGLVQEAIDNATENESYSSVPNSDQKLKLERRNGRWYVLAETLIGQMDPESLRNLTNFLGNISVEIERFHHAIGMEGVTGDDIDFQFGIATLQTMGAGEFDNVPNRFDVDSLPEPEPFEAIGESSILPDVDLETINHYRVKGQSFFKAFLSEQPDSFVDLLAPEVAALVDPEEIGALRDRVKAHWGNSKAPMLDITNVDYEIGRGYRVKGTLGVEGNQAKFDAFEVDDQWIGFSIQADQFGLDTRNLTQEVQPLIVRSTEFNSLFVEGDSEGAYRLFSGGLEPKGEDYEQFATGMPSGLKWLGSEPFAVRIAGEDDTRTVRVYSVSRVIRDEKEIRVRCVTVFYYESGEWKLKSFDTGALDEQFLMSDFSLQEPFFRALGEGNGQAFMKLFPKSAKDEIHLSVASAFCKQFQEKFGTFESIDRPEYMSEARFNASPPNIYGAGRVKFSEKDVVIETRHTLLELTSFKLLSNADEVVNFPAQIKDLTEMTEFGSRFIETLLSETPEQILGMLSSELRDELGDPQALSNSIVEFRENNGPMKSIRLTQSKYSDENHLLRLDFEIECEKRPLVGDVEIKFSALRGFVDRFNVKKKDDQ